MTGRHPSRTAWEEPTVCCVGWQKAAEPKTGSHLDTYPLDANKNSKRPVSSAHANAGNRDYGRPGKSRGAEPRMSTFRVRPQHGSIRSAVAQAIHE